MIRTKYLVKDTEGNITAYPTLTSVKAAFPNEGFMPLGNGKYASSQHSAVRVFTDAIFLYQTKVYQDGELIAEYTMIATQPFPNLKWRIVETFEDGSVRYSGYGENRLLYQMIKKEVFDESPIVDL